MGESFQGHGQRASAHDAECFGRFSSMCQVMRPRALLLRWMMRICFYSLIFLSIVLGDDSLRTELARQSFRGSEVKHSGGSPSTAPCKIPHTCTAVAGWLIVASNFEHACTSLQG